MVAAPPTETPPLERRDALCDALYLDLWWPSLGTEVNLPLQMENKTRNLQIYIKKAQFRNACHQTENKTRLIKGRNVHWVAQHLTDLLEP